MTALLAPAGTPEKLAVALAYGADEVYMGLAGFSLRAFAGNFDLHQLDRAIGDVHRAGKKAYVAANIFAFDADYGELVRAVGAAAEMGVDGVIVADLGVLFALRDAGIAVPIHVSTQANTLSARAVDAWRRLGAVRVNLARELSLEQIAHIRSACPHVELEVFVHGAVCFSYAGRCAISDYLTGRRANRGECTQPCRWRYALYEEKRGDFAMEAVEDAQGVHLFHTRDIALYAYVHALRDLGIDALKIEGRMKSVHYVAAVLAVYRRLVDGVDVDEAEIRTALSRVRNRGYSTGFISGEPPNEAGVGDTATRATSVFVGMVTQVTPSGCVVSVRNKIHAGEELEVLQPDGTWRTVRLPVPLRNGEGEGRQVLTCGTLLLERRLPRYAMLRRVCADPR